MFFKYICIYIYQKEHIKIYYTFSNYQQGSKMLCIEYIITWKISVHTHVLHIQVLKTTLNIIFKQVMDYPYIDTSFCSCIN